MGAIHYWRDYLKYHKNNVNTNDYILTFYINNKEIHINSKYYFFSNVVEMVRFVKYVILPSFTYSNIKGEEEEVIIEAVDYREMLNFFTINDKYYDKTLIKKYSYFFNKLEELEYGDFDSNEFSNICSEITEYFSKNDLVRVSVKYYKNINFLKNELDQIVDFNVDKSLVEIVNLMEKKELIQENCNGSF